jgi:hypothetical protein
VGLCDGVRYFAAMRLCGFGGNAATYGCGSADLAIGYHTHAAKAAYCRRYAASTHVKQVVEVQPARGWL